MTSARVFLFVAEACELEVGKTGVEHHAMQRVEPGPGQLPLRTRFMLGA